MGGPAVGIDAPYRSLPSNANSAAPCRPSLKRLKKLRRVIGIPVGILIDIRELGRTQDCVTQVGEGVPSSGFLSRRGLVLFLQMRAPARRQTLQIGSREFHFLV